MAHPEILLLHLLVSDDADKREFGVDQILRLRGDEKFGQTSNRPFLPPKLNWEAEIVKDLIDWEETVITEPIQTARLSTDEVKRFRDEPLSLRAFVCHTRSLSKIKNAVKNASEEVIGVDARDEVVHRRCDPKILVAKIPDDLGSDESDPDYDEELWADRWKQKAHDRDDDDDDTEGAKGCPALASNNMA